MSKHVTYTYSKAQIDNAIVSVDTAAKSLQQRIHNVAASILAIWQKESGARRISDDDAFEAAQWAVAKLNALQGASSYHAHALSIWIGMYLPCMWADETKSWYVHRDNCRLKGEAFVLARDNEFWTVSPPKAPKPFDMWDALQKIVDRAAKHHTKPVPGDDIDLETVRKLRELISSHVAS
jgi:hypothetical protein